MVLSVRSSPAEPRYLVAAYVVAPVLLGAAAARLPSGTFRALWACGFAALLAAHVSSAFHARRHLEDVDDSQVTAPIGRLIAALRGGGTTHAWANYWTAYRLSFESGGAIDATPIPLEDGTRDPHLDASVRAAADPAVVLLPPRTACFESYLREAGLGAEVVRVDAFTIFRRLPADLRDLVRAAGTLPMPRAAYAATWSVPVLPDAVAAGAAFPARLGRAKRRAVHLDAGSPSPGGLVGNRDAARDAQGPGPPRRPGRDRGVLRAPHGAPDSRRIPRAPRPRAGGNRGVLGPGRPSRHRGITCSIRTGKSAMLRRGGLEHACAALS